MLVSLRPAIRSDGKLVAELERDDPDNHEFLELGRAWAGWFWLVERGEQFVYIIQAEYGPVGWLVVEPSEDGFAAVSVYVTLRERRRGIATAALRTAAECHPNHVLVGVVEHGNTVPGFLAASLGYVAAETLDGGVRWTPPLSPIFDDPSELPG
ncbi:MAG: GNAT family N-acetyltransferase [Actinomycetota bacterium]|jgi:GNAT superfamily N-acetyltransferase